MDIPKTRKTRNVFVNCFVEPISSWFYCQPFSVLKHSLSKLGHAFKFDQLLLGSEGWDADEFHLTVDVVLQSSQG